MELLPGIPGLHVDAALTEYPALADDFAEILRDLGCDVCFAVEEPERGTSQLRAGEIWVPVLQVAETVGLGAVGSLVAEAIVRVADRLRRGRQSGTAGGDLEVHVLIGRGEEGDEVKWIELHGEVSEVLEALRTLTD
ncbi:hypothetical protein [Streptomyces sp. NRRL S-146]|uniref:hypothetical protein n=1 Tax=Streptomyces sp. NRRL S-146 TaxID=1463884 RepID=UPI0004C55FB3|nr:hypothetical protein [Streptomyces sp. NRRL S-146]